MSPKEIGEAFAKGAYKPLDYISEMITKAINKIAEATGGIKVPEPEIDFSGMSDELDKILGNAGQKGKTAGEAFSDEFSKIWEEHWEKSFNLGYLDTLEKQLTRLEFIRKQIIDVILKQTYDSIKAAPSDAAANDIAKGVFGARDGASIAHSIRRNLLSFNELKKRSSLFDVEMVEENFRQHIEGSNALAKVWDQIFDTQRKITEQQIDLIKAEGLGPDNIGNIDNLIERLKPFAKTSRAKLDLTAMRSEYVASSVSDSFTAALEKFNWELEVYKRQYPDDSSLDRIATESGLYRKILGEAIQEIKNTALAVLGTEDTPEIRQITKAYNDRLALYDKDEMLTLELHLKETAKQIDDILEKVAKLSRDELQKYWNEAIKLAKSGDISKYEKTIAKINKAFEERDRVLKIDEWYAALDDMAEVIGKFNREAGDSVRNFRDIATILNRMPEVTANIENSFAAIRDNINAAFEPYLGKNYVGQLFGGAAGMQAFGQGSSGTNWIGAIAGTLAGAGFGGPLMGAIAVGAGLVNAIWPGKEKDSGAENLKKQIDEYNEILKEWGAEYQSDNLSFKKDSGFLGWRGLFGNEIWETVGEEAARKGAEIAEQIIASMQQVFSNLASGAFDALFGFGGIDSLTKSVGLSLQNALMEAIVSTTAIKEPMQRLSAYIAEAVQDGLTSAELDHIKNMTGELWNSLSQYEDIAKEIADQFGLAEESAKGIGAALRNVPQGFKIALERFTAATGNQISAMQGLSQGMTMESNRTQIIIQGDVYGLDDFERKVESAMDKSDRRRRTRNYGVWAGAY
jgi:DNA-binding ferritin-like protein